MATDVIYNGITIHNAQTRQWDQEIVYDESHTDQLFSRYKLKFEGIIHSNYVTGAGNTSPAWTGQGSETTAISAYDNIRSLLQQVRGRLEVKFNDAVVLSVVPAVLNAATMPNMDLDNGPKPKMVSLTHIVHDQVFRVVFEIECALVESTAGSTGYLPNVLNNRWSINETMDDRFFITRTISGKMRLRSLAVDLDAMRTFIVPSLEDGFRRDRINYVVDPNGLNCTYEVVDKQIHTAAPWPAVRIEGTHSEHTSDSINTISTLHLRLEGHPGADKLALLTRGLQAVDARLFNNRGIDNLNKTSFVEDFTITDYIGDSNTIDINVSLRSTLTNVSPGDNEKLGNLSLATWGKPIDWVPMYGVPYFKTESQWPWPGGYVSQGGIGTAADDLRPAAMAVLFCYGQQPTVDAHRIRQSPTPNHDSSVTKADPTPPNTSGYVGTPFDYISPGNSLSYETKVATYTMATMDTRYIYVRPRVQMAIASDSEDTYSDTSVVCNLGRLQASREIRYDAERIGAWPTIPRPLDQFQDGAILGTFLHGWIRPMPPVLDATKQKPIFRISLYYLYALNRAPSTDEKMNVGVLPYTAFNPADTAIQLDTLFSTPLDPGEAA